MGMPHTSRRSFVKMGTAITGASVISGCLSSLQDGGSGYPSQEFILLNPYPPGGGTDVYFSQFVDPLSDEFGVNVRQEYESGAGTANAMRRIANTESNHIVTWQDVPIQTILQFDLDNPGFDIREFLGICSIATLSVNIIVPSESEYSDFDELRDGYQNGDISSIGAIATGSSWHWVTWLMKQEWDLAWEEYISYDGGGPLTSAVISGEVDAALILSPPIIDFVQEGDIQVVLNAGEESPDAFPEQVSTPGDYGLDATNIRAAGGELVLSVWGPPVLSDDERSTLEDGFINVMNSDEIQSWAEDAGQLVNPEEGSVAEERVEQSFELEESYREFRNAIE